MVLPIVASKQYEGTSRDGRRYNFTTLWVPLDDGTLYECRSELPYKQGDKVEFLLASRFGKLDLQPVSLAGHVDA